MYLCMEIQLKIIQKISEYFRMSLVKYVLIFLLNRHGKFNKIINISFVVQKSKMSTARIAMWKELNCPCVYTLETSFFGPTTVI